MEFLCQNGDNQDKNKVIIAVPVETSEIRQLQVPRQVD
jgi:hypothetical protein